MKRIDTIMLLTLLLLGTISGAAVAQSGEPTPPISAESNIPLVHIVAAGENLTLIAQQYDVSVDAILLINNLTASSIILPGQELIIPGGTGAAVPTIHIVQMGDTLPAIAQLYATTTAEILADNRLINPGYIPVVGQSVPVVSRTGSAEAQTITGLPILVNPGETLLEIAPRHNLSPLALAQINNLPTNAVLFPGQRLRVPDTTPYRELPDGWTTMEIGPQPIIQGNTVSIIVNHLDGQRPIGEFAGQPLRFLPHPSGYAALIGIDAFTQPGSYPLTLNATAATFEQPVNIYSGNYGTQSIILADEYSDLLDPAIRATEDEFLATFFTRFTETQSWNTPFQTPVTNTIVTAGYGDGRSYNGGPITIYHTGIDFSGTIGTPILASAPGTVIFSDILELRGQTVIIDHGMGVMTAYYHLSERFATVGETVEIGQPVGAGGSTGLSTGPHLHWDTRIMNVPVNGLQWTQYLFP